MKAALFSPTPYVGPAPTGVWPVPTTTYSVEMAEQSVERSLEQFELADQLGFDWVTMAEHHYSPQSLAPNPMIMAGAVAQRVHHARIALLGATIPFLNPVRVAEEFAMLDTLTGGRIVAGMLRGTANEYTTYHVNPAESRERFEEALELIVRAWTEPQPFGWQGRYYEYRAVSIWPRPVQQPHPPIYMSGSSPESGEFAARLHLHLGFAVTTLPIASAAARYYRQQAAAAGWEPTPDHILYRTTAYVTENDEQAFEDLGPPTSKRGVRYAHANPVLDEAAASAGYFGRDIATQRARVAEHTLAERIELGQIVCGNPDTVLRQIAAIHDELGTGIIELVFAGGSRDRTLRSIERFGTEVSPRLREIE